MPGALVFSHPVSRSRLTLWFIAAAIIVWALAGGVTWGLVALLAPERAAGLHQVPRAFVASTLLLAAGSLTLHQGLRLVRRERQKAFRVSLAAALVVGTLFVGVQGYALRCLIQNQDPQTAQTDVNAFVTIFAGLHALHFTLALLALVWVALNALVDRYDHEYYWGVTFCAWFWHALTGAWIVILGAFILAV